MSKSDRTETEYCCLKHKIDVSDLPADYDECPMCREQRRQVQVQIERTIRNRRLEPY